MMRVVLCLLALASCGGAHAAGAQESWPLHAVRRSLLTDSGGTLSLNATVLPTTGSWVSVGWDFSGSSSFRASVLDVVALYVPATANWSTTAPVKFLNATGLTTGSLSFRILNLRQPGSFVYFQLVRGSPVAVATSAPLSFANANEPTGVHLALSGTPGQVRVNWASWNASAVAAAVGGSPPGALWSLQPSALAAALSPNRTSPAASFPGVFLSAASSSTYGPSDLCAGWDGLPSVAQSSGWLAPGQLHSALLGSLPSGVNVSYAVGSDATGWSSMFSFTSPPLPGQPSALLVLADMGQQERDHSNTVNQGMGQAHSPYGASPGNGGVSYYRMPTSLNVTNRMAADVRGSSGGTVAAGTRPSLVLNNGDLAYANGYGALWDAYLDQIQSVSAAVPWMVSVGNHEAAWAGSPHSALYNDPANVSSSDSGGECGVPLSRRFPMPPPFSSSPNTPWYSFDHGAVHITVMSSEHPYGPGSAQRVWLEADLAAAAAARDGATLSLSPATGQTVSTAPRWLLFAGHRPFFLSVEQDESGYGAAQTEIAFTLEHSLQPLWEVYGVDLTLSGHHHSYQRSWPLARGVNQSLCVDGQMPLNATLHVVSGNGGASFSGFGDANGGSSPQDSLFAFRSNEVHGYLRIVADALTLNLTAVIGNPGQTFFDAVSIQKPAQGGRCDPVLPGASMGEPTPIVDAATLYVTCILFGTVCAAYIYRSISQWVEARHHSAHSKEGLAGLLEERHNEEVVEAEKRRLSLESNSRGPSRSISRRTSVSEEALSGLIGVEMQPQSKGEGEATWGPPLQAADAPVPPPTEDAF